MTGLIGIVVALALLIALAYRGVSVIVLAPATALLAVVMAGDAPVLATYTQVFMRATGTFIIQYFPLFLLGAIFGKLMEDSGSARALSDWIVARLGSGRAIAAVVFSCAILTYGGVSLFVVAFAVYPIAAALFRDAAIPGRLIPATIALGAFTFTMTALPGTPAIQNAIPMPFFGTTPFAAPGLGVVAGATMLGLGLLWLGWRTRRARLEGEGYGSGADQPGRVDPLTRERSLGEGFDVIEGEAGPKPGLPRPAAAVAVAPLILVIALNFLFANVIIPRLDTAYLARPEFGETTADAVRGIWAIIAALTISIVVLIALNARRLQGLTRAVDAGANASILPIFNTASQVGFGAVIASLAAFTMIRDAVLEIGGGNPLISLAISVNILAGITGSASGGMSIALQTLGDAYVAMAKDQGISLDLMHRVTAVATGGLDALPHNGAVITLLAICGMSHRAAYADILVVAVLVPLFALCILVLLGTMFGSF